VERIYTKLKNKAHYVPVHVMLYTLPGIPSLYYGSEFGIEGRKEQFSDDSLRPALNYEDYKNAKETNSCTKLIAALGKIRQNTPALKFGEYKELELQTAHFAYARVLDGKSVIVTVNNGDNEVSMNLEAFGSAEYTGALSGEKVAVNGGRILVKVPANSGEIWIPTELCGESFAPVKTMEIKKTEVVKAPESLKPETSKQEEPLQETSKPEAPQQEPIKQEVPQQEASQAVNSAPKAPNAEKSYEEMSVEELQEVILEKMRRNGPVTDYMLGTVRENTHHGSLVSWARSF